MGANRIFFFRAFVAICIGWFGFQNQAAAQDFKRMGQEARLAFDEGNFGKAGGMYQKLLERYPRDVQYRLQLGACLTETRTDLPRATNLLTEGFARSSDPVALYYLGLALRFQFEFEESQKALRRFEKEATPSQRRKFGIQNQLVTAKAALALLEKVPGWLASEPGTLSASSGGPAWIPKTKDSVKLEDGRVKMADAIPPESGLPVFSTSSGSLRFSSNISGNHGWEIGSLDQNEKNPRWVEAKCCNSDFNDLNLFRDHLGQKDMFSSNRPGGLGQYDVYQVDLNSASKKERVPLNLGFPINSPYDEWMAVYSPDHDTLWVLTNRFRPTAQPVWMAFVQIDSGANQSPNPRQYRMLAGEGISGIPLWNPRMKPDGSPNQKEGLLAESFCLQAISELSDSRKILQSMVPFCQSLQALHEENAKRLVGEAGDLNASLQFISDDSIGRSISRSRDVLMARAGKEQDRASGAGQLLQDLSAQLVFIDQGFQVVHRFCHNDSLNPGTPVTGPVWSWWEEFRAAEWYPFQVADLVGAYEARRRRNEAGLAKVRASVDTLHAPALVELIEQELVLEQLCKEVGDLLLSGANPAMIRPVPASESLAGTPLALEADQSVGSRVPDDSLPPAPTSPQDTLAVASPENKGAEAQTAEKLVSPPALPDLYLEPGVFYTVQLGTFKNSTLPGILEPLDSLFHALTSMGFHRYTRGKYLAFSQALHARDSLVAMGFSDAFVVGMKDGRQEAVSNIRATNPLDQTGVITEPRPPKRMATPLPEIVKAEDNSPQTNPAVFYSIQLAAVGETDIRKIRAYFQPLAGEQDLFIFPGTGGLTVVSAGKFQSAAEAAQFRDSLKNSGLQGVFLIGTDGTRKIPLEEVKKNLHPSSNQGR